jgi:hypothetical protein
MDFAFLEDMVRSKSMGNKKDLLCLLFSFNFTTNNIYVKLYTE